MTELFPMGNVTKEKYASICRFLPAIPGRYFPGGARFANMRPFVAYRQRSLVVMRPFFAYRQKSLFIPWCVQVDKI